MVSVKPLDQVVTKFVTRANAAGPDYDAGVRSPKKDYAKNTLAAEGNFKSAVVEAANAGRFGKGVAKAGTAKWQKKSIDKGTARYGPGVSASKDDYQAGFQPYHSALGTIQLPAKGPKGAPQNIQLVATIANALHKLKTTGSAA